MAPGLSLFKVFDIGTGRPWRSVFTITAHKPKPEDLGRRWLCDLSNEIIIFILITKHLQDISPGSVVVLASVSSFMYNKARYVQHCHITISLKPTKTKSKSEIGSVRYLSSNGLLPAIRTLRFVDLVYEPEKGYQFPTPLYGLIDQMTSLCDIHLDALWYPVTTSVLNYLKQRTQVRLHISVKTFDEQSRAIVARELTHLAGSPNLHSLQVDAYYFPAKECLETTRPLKGLLLSCPNLRKLSLDIYRQRKDCMSFEPCTEYCGPGLVGDERLPSFEELVIFEYPWGRDGSSGFPWGVKGYPGKNDKIAEDYWAHHCDWSRLRRLIVPKGSLAHRIAQQLTALDEVDLYSGSESLLPVYKHDERAMIHFFETIPSMLDSITVPNFASLSTTPIIRHGSRLRSLELICPIPYCGQPESRCTGGIASSQDLVELRDRLPRLEHHPIHISTDGNDWSYPTLDILATFPRLRSVKLRTASRPTPRVLLTPRHLHMLPLDPPNLPCTACVSPRPPSRRPCSGCIFPPTVGGVTGADTWPGLSRRTSSARSATIIAAGQSL